MRRSLCVCVCVLEIDRLFKPPPRRLIFNDKEQNKHKKEEEVGAAWTDGGFDAAILSFFLAFLF